MEERAAFSKWPGALKKLAEDLGEAVQGRGAEFPDSCQARRELDGSDAPALLQIAFSQGSMLTHVARDQLEGIIRSLQAPVLTIAPWGNARSALESCALGSWLLDPSVGERERVSRSLAFRCEGQHQQISLGKATGKPASEKQSRDRLKQIVRTGVGCGYPELRVKSGRAKGELVGVGERMPGITMLIETVFSKGADYKIMCSMVHSHPWALQQLGFMPKVNSVGEAEKVSDAGGDLHLYKKGMPPSALKYLARTTGEVICDLHRREWALFGWDLKRLEEVEKKFFVEFSP